MNRPDLHLHSSASDGVYSPEELVEAALRAGVTHIALTDHDTLSGSDRLRGTDLHLQVIPGVELSLRDMRSLHLLGYGCTEAAHIRSVLKQQARERVSRADAILERLRTLGMSLPMEEIAGQCRDVIGRPHIARAMIKAGYAKDMNEAFDRWLGDGKPAYVPYHRLCMEEAIALLRADGFVPVLAHPCELRLEDQQLLSLLNKWKEMGLMGMEVYHPSAFSHGFPQLDRMARRLDLLVTGGSDFHQENDRHGAIGSMLPRWQQAESDLSALLDAVRTNR